MNESQHLLRRAKPLIAINRFRLDGELKILKGVGPVAAEYLRTEGVLSWDLLKQNIELLPLSARSRILKEVEDCYSALERRDASFFLGRIPRSDYWMLATAFPENVIFLDIETTGLSRIYHELSLIGWSKGDNYEAVSGVDSYPGLTTLKDALTPDSILVTFNGSHFDLPFLKHHIPNFPTPMIHVDLRHLGNRVGLRGGQKKIEATLGVTRSRRASGVDGEQAPALWYRYLRGDTSALLELIEYNHADIEGMKRLFEEIFHRLNPSLKHTWQSSSFEFWKQRDAQSANPIICPITKGYEPRLHLRDLSLPPLRVVGIDLSGSSNRPTGWALLEGSDVQTAVLRTDAEILEQTVTCKPDLVSIDAPLSLPAGRRSVDDSDPARIEFGIARQAERILWSRGVKTYPALIRSMQGLTARGIRLAESLRSLGIPVIESFPGAMQDILGMPRKGMSLPELKRSLCDFGINFPYPEQKLSHDEIDAISSAIVGQTFWSGYFEPIGIAQENFMIIPSLTRRDLPRVITISGPIAAGKTELARMLEERGFARVGYNEVLAEEARSSERDTPISTEATAHNVSRRALNERVFARTEGCMQVVIDGTCYLEDHAYAAEQAGAAHTAVFLDAESGVRKERWRNRNTAPHTINKAERDQGKKHLNELRHKASIIFDNSSSLDALEMFADILSSQKGTQ